MELLFYLSKVHEKPKMTRNKTLVAFLSFDYSPTRLLLVILSFASVFSFANLKVTAQDRYQDFEVRGFAFQTDPRSELIEALISGPVDRDKVPEENTVEFVAEDFRHPTRDKQFSALNKAVYSKEASKFGTERKYWFNSVKNDSDFAEKVPVPILERNYDDPDKAKEQFYWKPAFVQSGIFLGIQHGFRLFQQKTRREFDGPFFRDWGNSVTSLRGWRDGDSEFINYIAHPLQGGVTGRIFINNSDNASRQVFSNSRAYWESRFRTFIWSAAWSTQFEIGPFSEATIGNVGLRNRGGHSAMAWVDLVVTPVVGTGVVIAEDVIDKYILRKLFERNQGYRLTKKIKILRTFLTPTTSFTNILRGKFPWKRDFR